MTTIAVSKTEIAGDRQATHSAGMVFRLKTKLHKFAPTAFYPTEFYVGLAGNLDDFSDVLSFFQSPEGYKKAPRLKGGEGLILGGDGKIWTFSRADVWIPVDQKFYAIGSGMLYAMGAMENGATPTDAVKAACKFDPGSGMGVTSFRLKAPQT